MADAGFEPGISASYFEYLVTLFMQNQECKITPMTKYKLTGIFLQE